MKTKNRLQKLKVPLCSANFNKIGGVYFLLTLLSSMHLFNQVRVQDVLIWILDGKTRI